MVRLGITGLACAVLAGCAPRAGATVAAPAVEVPVHTVGGRPIVTGDDPHDDGRSAGDHVEVEWNGSWWPAVLLERRGDGWLIHYEGYGDEWDEIVGHERLRDRRPAEPDDEPVMLPDDDETP